ncbi:MAG TPA: hypothetical protein VJH05_00650 [Candidatus Paceibacterota bacterium]
MRAVLKKPALLSILCATAETFKKESYLFLLGYKKNENFVIEHAIPFQTAKRNFGQVENISYREKLVINLSEFFWKNSQIIGDCHSHTEFGGGRWCAIPSEQDKKDSEQNGIYIIVGISVKRKTQQWKKTKNGGVLGSIGKYKFEVNAFWAPEDKKLEQIPLICPSAHRLNAFKK